MEKKFDSDSFKIPAFMRNKAIVRQSRQKLILTALDRKEAGLSHRSKKALAPVKSTFSRLQQTAKRFNRAEDLSPTPRNLRHYENFTLEDAINAQQNEFDQEIQEPILKEENFQTPFKEKMYAMGEITHYLDKIGVAIILLCGNLKQNDTILVTGDDFLFVQKVAEIQIDRNPVQKASKGAHVGLKVNHPAKIGGKIYKLFSSKRTS